MKSTVSALSVVVVVAAAAACGLTPVRAASGQGEEGEGEEGEGEEGEGEGRIVVVGADDGDAADVHGMQVRVGWVRPTDFAIVLDEGQSVVGDVDVDGHDVPGVDVDFGAPPAAMQMTDSDGNTIGLPIAVAASAAADLDAVDDLAALGDDDRVGYTLYLTYYVDGADADGRTGLVIGTTTNGATSTTILLPVMSVAEHRDELANYKLAH